MRKEIPLMTELVSRSRTSYIGRTALMKCLYFLKALRKVPLDYDFQLYTYGPFDQEVLEDLSYAESLGAIATKLVVYPNGYGYELRPGPKMIEVKRKGEEFVAKYGDSIDWVLREFAHRRSSDLEMLGTIVFVAHHHRGKIAKDSLNAIAGRVHEIKPHLEVRQIKEEAGQLEKKGLLTRPR